MKNNQKLLKKETLTEFQSKEILEKYIIKTPKSFLVKSKKEAIKKSRELEFPIVMKLMSPDILHKSEARIVKTNIINEKEIIDYYDILIDNALTYNKNAKIEGILIEETLRGIELIAGLKKDHVFGHIILIGTGGIYAELLKDISIRKTEITKQDALSMIKELKIYPVLKNGYRNIPPANLKKLISCLVNLSKMAKKENILEMDINPLFVNEKDVIAGDVRIIKETN